MSGGEGHNATPAEGAPPAVETTMENATAPTAPTDVTTKETPAAESEKAAAEPAPAPTTTTTITTTTTTTEESDKAAEASSEKPAEKPAEEAEQKPDVEMTDAAAAPAEPAPEAAQQAEQATNETRNATDADAADKFKSKRKSIGGGESKGKKLNKKASKPRMLHLDAKPGEHYFHKLKGHPQWPVIICDEDMLPASLLKSRPVTAKRADGTYREDFADGGKKVADRTFPVMYLHTNEFGWVPNSELIDLDPATVLDVKLDKMKKSLQAAHQLAAENHPLSYYKELLQNYQEDLIQQEKARAAKAATPKGKKSKAVSEEDEDVDMEDAPSASETPAKDKKAKKRKAEDNAETPQRSDSVKKPKIKLTTSSTPKTANGATSTPKSGKASEPKGAKSKSKKADEKKAEEKVSTPKEPELSPEDRRARKEKEVLFLRHKLQKGLLTRDQEPKEEEMKLMSDYITKLEGFPDLEVSIIRATKINKVLKAILKLEKIPKEDEFKFKPRATVLLEKWNKILAAESGAAAAESGAAVNGTSKAATKEVPVREKDEGAEAAKATDEAKEAPKEAVEGKKGEEAKKEEAKEAVKEGDKKEEAPATAEKPAAEESKAPEAVEASA
ncbi:hypothetical protein VTK26DRAFT_1062 [Humicola hyalothermophila]